MFCISCVAAQDIYVMSSEPRGYAVVITMTKNRRGANVEERDITELFQQLKFDVRTLKDQTKDVG